MRAPLRADATTGVTLCKSCDLLDNSAHRRGMAVTAQLPVLPGVAAAGNAASCGPEDARNSRSHPHHGAGILGRAPATSCVVTAHATV